VELNKVTWVAVSLNDKLRPHSVHNTGIHSAEAPISSHSLHSCQLDSDAN